MKGNYIGNNPNGLDFVLVDNKTTIEKNKKIVSKDIAINGDDTDLASERGIFNAVSKENVDYNTLVDQGVYAVANTGSTNGPGYAAKVLVCSVKGSAFITQIAVGVDRNTITWRYKTESATWTPWKKIILETDVASTSKSGIVQLNNTTSSTSASQAATANAVKLAYDKAVAAYTKAESAQGSSASADKLTTARTIQTNLASTTSASFDGTENVTPGVTGVLPAANGGTGRTDGKAVGLATARTIDGVSFNGTANITHFGVCSTEAATAAKTVSVSGFTLATGAELTVQFTVTNTAASPTLNVNGTGAKAIVYRNAAISASYLASNRVYKFVYDGTNYELIGDVNTDTNTKVTQTVTTTNAEYPLLVSADADKTSSSTTTASFASAVTLNPSTKKISCSGISGKPTASIFVNSAKDGGSLIDIPGLTTGGYQPIFKTKSTNGAFVMSGYKAYLGMHYITDENIEAGTNTVTQSLKFNESGLLESSGGFKGSLTGNASSATKLATARTIDGVSFNGSANITHFGICSTEAATAAKVVSVANFVLATGSEVTVQFTVTNTAASPTLNVNGTGAKAIVYRNVAISAGYLAANRVYKFVYDGTNYELIGDINTDIKYTAATAAPKAPGTAAVGTSTKYAREDHVHPLQTTTSGNADTATKLKTARTITVKHVVSGSGSYGVNPNYTGSGSATFDGSGNVTISINVGSYLTADNNDWNCSTD